MNLCPNNISLTTVQLRKTAKEPNMRNVHRTVPNKERNQMQQVMKIQSRRTGEAKSCYQPDSNARDNCASDTNAHRMQQHVNDCQLNGWSFVKHMIVLYQEQ